MILNLVNKMKVICISNTGKSLRPYEYHSLKEEEFGRFGASFNTEYGEVKIGQEYLVMGIIMFESYLAYLIDDNGLISACPCQLFEVIDDKIVSEWHFRLIKSDENIYPFIQAIWGYYELCFNENSYENLIVEKDEGEERIYFRRKIELEKRLNHSS